VIRSRARVLVVGMGGLGCPAALALARSGIGLLGMSDDDVVDESNLHRQILFGRADVGLPKLGAAERALRAAAPELSLRMHATRLLPENAVEMVKEYDVVVEGSDNFATKFLASDACLLAGVPIVHGGAIRWVGTALAVGAHGQPCYRCLFEDLPDGAAPNCAEAGVMGPVVGIVAALQVDLALGFIDGASVAGELAAFDGRTDVLRRHRVTPRPDCRLCGPRRKIRRIKPEAYGSPACAG
jgi:molybdopterin/thiamine biosynthesis adenylyltransferase